MTEQVLTEACNFDTLWVHPADRFTDVGCTLLIRIRFDLAQHSDAHDADARCLVD